MIHSTSVKFSMLSPKATTVAHIATFLKRHLDGTSEEVAPKYLPTSHQSFARPIKTLAGTCGKYILPSAPESSQVLTPEKSPAPSAVFPAYHCWDQPVKPRGWKLSKEHWP